MAKMAVENYCTPRDARWDVLLKHMRAWTSLSATRPPPSLRFRTPAAPSVQLAPLLSQVGRLAVVQAQRTLPTCAWSAQQENLGHPWVQHPANCARSEQPLSPLAVRPHATIVKVGSTVHQKVPSIV
jgi:hypothetical protein